MNRIERLIADTRRVQESPFQLRREDLLPNSVGNAAYLRLGTTVTAAILGLEVDQAAIEQHRQWLADSADREEVFGDPPDYFAMVHREALGLASWMSTGETDVRMFDEAVRRHQLALGLLTASGSTSPDQVVHDYLPDVVRDCLSAGRCDRGLATYTRHSGPPPVDPAEVDTPLQLAAWLCSRLTEPAPPAEWLALGERVLRPVLLGWLDRGQGVRAAHWLKLVYGDSGATLSPLDALRRGGQLIGAVPVDPLAELLLVSLGDPIDVDLFAGFLAAVGAAALPAGAVITAEFTDAPPLIIPTREPEVSTGLNRSVAAALTVNHPGTLPSRLADAARGRIADVDGETPITLHSIVIS